MQESTRRRQGFRAGLLVPILIVCLTGIFSVPAESKAAESDAHWFAKSLDASLLRPLGVIRLAAGSLIYLPISFFNGLGQSSVATLNTVGLASAPNWDVFSETLDLFVLSPGRFVFTRPLGEDLYGDN